MNAMFKSKNIKLPTGKIKYKWEYNINNTKV